MQRSPPRSMRFVLTASTTVLALLAAITTVSLIALTTRLRTTTRDLDVALEEVQAIQGIELELLRYARAVDDPAAQAKLRANVVRALEEERRYVPVASERGTYAEARTRVWGYLADSRDEGLLEAAYRALDLVVAASTGRAVLADTSAEALNRVANVLGVLLAILFLGSIAVLARWITRALGIADAIQSFGVGNRDARAVDRGSGELRLIARTFNEMAETLAHEQQARLTFLAAVAHDLRNPLAALRISLDRLSPARPLPDEPSLRRLFGLISRQADRLERMVSDFVDAEQIESGKLELELGRHDARDLVTSVCELFRPTATAHEIVEVLPEHAVPVRCDAARIDQVLNNLVSNAIKYSPGGGRVEVGVAIRQNRVVFHVTDQGMGLAPEDQQRIFEPFERVGLSKEAIPGVGLGLFNARRIVEAHRGTISVTSSPGAGATFRVTLDLAP